MKIILDRVEGLVSECRRRVYANFSSADAQLALWAKTAPADGSYHKVDFSVYLAGAGEPAYEGRYDMTRYGEGNEMGHSLLRHIADSLEFQMHKERCPNPKMRDFPVWDPKDCRDLLDRLGWEVREGYLFWCCKEAVTVDHRLSTYRTA